MTWEGGDCLHDCTLGAWEGGDCMIVHWEHGRLVTAWLCIGSTGGWRLHDCALGACIWEVGDCMIVHWERAYGGVGDCMIVHWEHGRVETAWLCIGSMGGWWLHDCALGEWEGGDCMIVHWKVGDCMIVHWECAYGRLVTAWLCTGVSTIPGYASCLVQLSRFSWSMQVFVQGLEMGKGTGY